VAAAAGLLGLLVLFHWLERDGPKDTFDGHVSFLDVIYFTMISATTTGYGDIVPVTNNTRLFDALVVTPIRTLFLLFFIGTAYLFVAQRTWERFIMKRIQRAFATTSWLSAMGQRTAVRSRRSSSAVAGAGTRTRGYDHGDRADNRMNPWPLGCGPFFYLPAMAQTQDRHWRAAPRSCDK
jgi:hypothetical protein